MTRDILKAIGYMILAMLAPVMAGAQFNPRHEFDNVPRSLCPTLYRSTEGQHRKEVGGIFGFLRRTELPQNLEYHYTAQRGTEVCIARVLEHLKTELAGVCTADPFLAVAENERRVKVALQGARDLCTGGPFYGPSAAEFLSIPRTKLVIPQP